jgi:hypothetical protein
VQLFRLWLGIFPAFVLVVRAKIYYTFCYTCGVILGIFIQDLSFEDLRMLRKIVQAEHKKTFGGHELSNVQADQFIESLAPEVTEKVLKAAVDGGLR